MTAIFRTAMALGLCVGCGSSGGLGKPVAQFPTRAALDSVAEHTAKPVLSLKTAEVDRWEVRTSIPAPAAAYVNASPWDEELAAAVGRQGGKVRLAPELACAAQESARFYLEQGGYPDDALRAFLVARCGSSLPSVRISTFEGSMPAGAGIADVARQTQANFRQLLAQSLAGVHEIGAGSAEGDGKFVVVLLGGEQRARLDAFSPLVSGNTAVIAGEVPRDASSVLGLINRGEYEVELCEADRRLRLPKFRLACPLGEGDDIARIQVTTQKHEQVLLSPAIEVLVRRTDEAGLVFEAPLYGQREPVADSAAFARALLAGLNEVRRAAGRSAVGIEATQSTVNQRLAPHLFEAMFARDSQRVDTIALGLLAGWDVNGVIRGGGIFSGYSATTRSPARWLGYAMQSPLGRWVLLEKDASRVAIGASGLEPSGVLALVTTYSFFDSTDHRADEDAVFADLSKARVARGLPAPVRVQRAPALGSALQRIATSKSTTEDALSDAMQTISTSAGRGVSGWIVEASDLLQLPFDDTLLRPGPLEVQIGVTHYKAPGAAWGQYAVLVLVLEDGARTLTARRAKPAVRVLRAGVGATRGLLPDARRGALR